MQGDLNPTFPKGVDALCGNEQSCTPVIDLGCSQRWVSACIVESLLAKKDGACQEPQENSGICA